MKKISVPLSVSGVNRAIKELEAYQKRIERKNKTFLNELAKIGIETATVTYGSGVVYDQKDRPTVIKTPTWVDDNTLIIRAKGESIAFVEFGAGVFYNTPVGTSPHPLGSEKGFTIGSYGEGRGEQEKWGYRDSDGKLHFTNGQPSIPGMYKASQYMRDRVVEIAKRVFKDD